jgi:hypothetical protein
MSGLLSALSALVRGLIVCMAVGISTWANADGTAWPAFRLELPQATRTHLVRVEFGTGLSRTVTQARSGGYESAQGHWISMDRWYRSTWKDLRLTWLTQLDENNGLIWGLGTGERGEKFTIEPSLKLGWLHQRPLGRHGLLALRLTAVLGGRLKERGCVADYGAVGGVQAVNCRLAATPLPPAETLKLLFHEPPKDRLEASIQYRWMF